MHGKAPLLKLRGMSVPLLEVHPSPRLVAEAAAERVVRHAREALERKETFAFGLAGGSTPRLTYELLADEESAGRIEWPRVEVFFGDERCVPPHHPQSNYGMAMAALLDRVPIPGDNIYRMKGELDPQEAAMQYGELLKEKFGDGGLDLLLLGMGEDGHTLSLFPRTEALEETKHRCVANFVPQLKGGEGEWRITLTAPFANRSGHVLALVAGANKAAAVREVLEADADSLDYPIKLIDPSPGKCTMLLDAAAAGMKEGKDEG